MIFRLVIWVALCAISCTSLLLSSSTSTVARRGDDASSLTGLSTSQVQNLATIRYGDSLSEKVVVITGATGGIGSELCRVFTQNLKVAKVVALDFNAQALESLQNECGERLHTIVSDHADLDSVSAAAQTICDQYGQVDVLVNNAGIWYPFDDDKVELAGKSKQGYDLLFQINYLAGFLLTEGLLPLLTRRDSKNDVGGRVVQVVSTKHWTVNGSDLWVDSVSTKEDNDLPSLLASRSTKRSHQHVENSYGNSKLAQMWHARVLADRHQNLETISACPSWAATGIAGDHPNKDVLTTEAFATTNCGPGITSVLNAMLRTPDELQSAMGSNASEYVANSKVWTNLLPPGKGLWVTSPIVSRWRAQIVFYCTMVILFTQQWFHDDFILQATSPESKDKARAESLYQWSLKAVQPWL